MDVHLLQSLGLGQVQQGEEVVNVAVDPTVREQAHQVEGTAILPAGLDGLEIGGVLEEGALLDGPADPREVLKHHPAGADVGVAHLAVAHLPLREPHV